MVVNQHIIGKKHRIVLKKARDWFSENVAVAGMAGGYAADNSHLHLLSHLVVRCTVPFPRPPGQCQVNIEEKKRETII